MARSSDSKGSDVRGPRPLPERHDLAIVGAGPSGLAAALRARRDGASAVVLEKRAAAHAVSCSQWVSPAAVALCREWGLSAKAAGGAEFSGVRIHSLDLRKSAVVKDAELSGWVVERATFDAALAAMADKAGATVVHGAGPKTIALGEDRVTIRLDDGRSTTAGVLLVADGAASETARIMNVTTAIRSADLAAFVTARGPALKGNVGIEVAIGAGRSTQLATIVRSPVATQITLFSRVRSPSVIDQFRQICAAAVAAGMLPAALESETSGSIALGAALDTESHVGKRWMLIGDAGGFVSSFSGEGLYPALRSGCIAAEVAQKALKSRWVQDELATFGGVWRAELADYLRMPNTDLALLMPLVFSNAQMSGRVARALLLGQQF